MPAAENNLARPSSAVGTLEWRDEESDAGNLDTDAYRVGLKEDLLSALSAIQTSGSFASFGVLPQPPPVDLFVNDVGDISLPLSEFQACQLIAKARQAPYGKGSATIVDTTVRNTWELDAGQFTFRNPDWPGFIRDLCARVALDLGINEPITAQIYKMLIYEKGAMFKAHTDTEKIPGMFGTLVICLPSMHQGGEVVLKHCGEKKVFRTSEVSQSFASWYSDVSQSHEVLPVTSGFRWVLTYNLALDLTGPGPSASLPRFETPALRRTLKQWLSVAGASRERNCVYHVLDHDYTEANISLKALKARDFAQVHVLKEISSELAVDVFLRYAKYSHYDYDDDESNYHNLDEVFETKYAVKTLVDLEGNVVTQGLHLNEDDILQENCFENLEAEEEYEGFMGNSGPTATHWYRVMAVVIVPRDSLVSFFNSYDHSWYSSPQKNLKAQIRYLARTCLQPQAPESAVNALVKLSRQAWNNCDKTTNSFMAQEPSINGDGIRDVLVAAIQHGKYTFFEEAADYHQGFLPLDFFVWMRQWLSTGSSVTDGRFHAVRKGIYSAISSYPYFADQFRAITNFVPIPNDSLASDTGAAPNYILDWAREKLHFCLDACASKSLGCEDGPAMVDLALYFNDCSTFLSQIVAPRIDQRHDATAFYLAFLARLRQQSTKGILPMKSTMQLYQTKARSFITLADFTQFHSDARVQATPAKRASYGEQAQRFDRRTAISYEVLADFFSAIVQSSTEADDLVAPFVSKLVANAYQLPAVEFHALWLPFLRCLIPILASNAIPLDTPYCHQLFSALLQAYLDGYVGHEPTKDRNLVLRGVDCSCSDCESLNAFLASPTQRVGFFAVNKQRRGHLHRGLDSCGVDCTHETRRSGSPQTLVVTKTFQHNKKMRLDWKSRFMLVEGQIRQFKQGHLSLLLGPNYATIVNMAHLSTSELAQGQSPPVISASPRTTTQPRRPLQAISSVAGVNRKFSSTETDIIDLTRE
ncbi:hypothetical protein TASIC1_0001000500 [Trichoderma asperellum]|uniref:Prolyl 4-hydroxylase alpha subunit Fe(2+) 2OG dioxygenase domain-containing protein n=1 Tax=Trichoderma asperellum TaxID=101201 RepID=A0A6V8QMZ6_TRIAP|nr:hypothetical protein LI328DRAFT_147626 [Trichoderma asperelloides]GFP51853.1 hypothetical protein TASIC1_0001000500 [Trichoderma asperellum]